MSTPRIRHFLLLCLLVPITLVGQEMTAFTLLQSDSVLNVRLTTDIKQLVKNKYKETEQPGTVDIMYPDGTEKSFEVTVVPRGNRRKDVCSLPPIHVVFPKEQFKHRKIKWVLPCGTAQVNDQNLLEEFMCYRMYEQLTPVSFQTALLRIEFVDLGRKEKAYTLFGFAIEDVDELADRMNGNEYDPKLLNEAVLQQQQLAYFTMFQYMIANTDWGIVNLHNLKIVTDTIARELLPIPYDFDYSGVVDAAYAIPNEFVPIEKVTERYNWGKCLPEAEVEVARQTIVAKRAGIEQMIMDFPYYDKKVGKQMVDFLDAFFRDMENSDRTKSLFCTNMCRETDQ